MILWLKHSLHGVQVSSHIMISNTLIQIFLHMNLELVGNKFQRHRAKPQKSINLVRKARSKTIHYI